ncbi:hypothetical protein QC761_0070640 [Podospora bellae-mahoneyi]|uniref:Uncharacterized protein n=1 Tax=Podospora bellae-mahoneyi TaxID=2093777 RepID=A0ABR0FIB3_9PEZI|nr:hypothetical protein QC761_0070640 [Podospora bellae-mahoneyi]
MAWLLTELSNARGESVFTVQIATKVTIQKSSSGFIDSLKTLGPVKSSSSNNASWIQPHSG